jgi:1-acyl-sn-glycerol-3-phosphate acyltransferase
MIRSVLVHAVMVVSGLLLSLYGLFLMRFAPRGVAGRQLPAIGALWARITLAALRVLRGVRIEVTGEIPAGGGVIIAAQHQSELDIFVLLTLLRRPSFVLKQELQKIPIFGAVLTPAGLVAVDRAGGAAALRKMVADCRTQLAAGRPIVIFPEGTRVAPGARGDLQPGVVALARALDVPVIPVTTNSGLRWPRAGLLKTPGPVHVTVGPPLPPKLPRPDFLAALAARFYGQQASGGNA